MVTLGSLWLPILLGGVAVFFASFVMRMVLKHHWSDFQKLPDEDGLMQAMRAVPAGSQFTFPHCKDPQMMKDPEYQAKWAEGPAGFLFLFPPGQYSFGKSLYQSFLFNVFVAFVAAYLASMALTPEASDMTVLRFTATVGFMGFGAAVIWGPIWMASSWKVCLEELIDALVYGLAMGLVFMLLWPAA